MNLSPRLKKIAELVEPSKSVADVGTDHAYLPVYLLENNIITKAIASDLNEGPLQNAVQTIEKSGATASIETRLGGGLVPYSPGEVDIAIIAGMGGMLIASILDASEEVARSVDYLLLQPMQASDYLRRWLEENNYLIEKEVIEIEGNKYYEILKVRSGEMSIDDELYYEIGCAFDVDDENYRRFLKFKLKKYIGIKEKLKSSSKDNEDLEVKCDKNISMIGGLLNES